MTSRVEAAFRGGSTDVPAPHAGSVAYDAATEGIWRGVRVGLRRRGLLLLTDRRRPSVVSLVVGQPVSGSWWGHPAGRLIYAVAGRLEGTPGVLVTKLLDGKVTFVDRRLAPSVVAMGRSEEAWQVGGLSPRTRHLLSQIERAGSVRLDRIEADAGAGFRGLRSEVLELERRMLLHTASIHTDRGNHATVLEAWSHVARRLKLPRPPRVPTARTNLETAARDLDPTAAYPFGLPWQTAHRRSGSRKERIDRT